MQSGFVLIAYRAAYIRKLFIHCLCDAIVAYSGDAKQINRFRIVDRVNRW